MNTELLKPMIEDVVMAAKAQAIVELKKMDTNLIKELVKAEIARVTAPLETEATLTKSWWVRVRNHFYIYVLNKSIDTIVSTINGKIKEM